MAVTIAMIFVLNDDVKALLPSDAEPIIEWFENNYVHGKVKRLLRNGSVQRHDPLFPPSM